MAEQVTSQFGIEQVKRHFRIMRGVVGYGTADTRTEAIRAAVQMQADEDGVDISAVQVLIEMPAVAARPARQYSECYSCGQRMRFTHDDMPYCGC